jgi:N-acetylglucosamine-6-phosphate deacetylase
VHPKAIELLIRLKGIDNVSLITDGTPYTYMSDGEYTTEYGQEAIVSNGTVKLKDGTIAGSMMPMNEQFRNLVKGVGLPISSAIRMVSVNPAKVLNIFSEVGSLEPGKEADMVIMDKDMNVLKTIVGGRVVYQAD